MRRRSDEAPDGEQQGTSVNSLFLEDPKDLLSLIETGETVLLAFTAEFCGPSRVLRGVLDAVIAAEELPATIVEVDVEKFPLITRQYQVKGTPQLMLLVKAEPVASRIGTMSYDQLLDFLYGCVPA